MNKISEVKQYLENNGFSDIVLPHIESQDSKYCSYNVLSQIIENKTYILVVPCNLDKIIGNEYREGKIIESPKETALRALYNDTAVTSSNESLDHLTMRTLPVENKKQRQYVFFVKEFFCNELQANPSDSNKGEPFFFPLDKLNKILEEKQRWIIFKIKEKTQEI